MNKKSFVKLFVNSVQDNKDYKITQAKLAKNLTELRKKVSDIIFVDQDTFQVVTQPIICEDVNFGQFNMTFSRKDPHNVWVTGGSLNFSPSMAGYPENYACHMNIYQKNGVGVDKPKRVCLSSSLDRAIDHFYSINDLSGVVQVVLTMFEGNKLSDGLGQHGWFYNKIKRCEICDDKTKLNEKNVCKQCSLLQITE